MGYGTPGARCVDRIQVNVQVNRGGLTLTQAYIHASQSMCSRRTRTRSIWAVDAVGCILAGLSCCGLLDRC